VRSVFRKVLQPRIDGTVRVHKVPYGNRWVSPDRKVIGQKEAIQDPDPSTRPGETHLVSIRDMDKVKKGSHPAVDAVGLSRFQESDRDSPRGYNGS
jgi:hypothetical protein